MKPLYPGDIRYRYDGEPFAFVGFGEETGNACWRHLLTRAPWHCPRGDVAVLMSESKTARRAA